MAVIIHGDKIVAAAVQLPLSEAEKIGDMELGSRHRAAMGMSSGCDASVIVVSEETGIVSIATNGKLVRKVDESQLREHLMNAMTLRESRWFKRIPRKTVVVDAARIGEKDKKE
jgi:diadenylate cyclase